MEFVQERITTLHDFGTGLPEPRLSEAAIVVPMTEREHSSLAAERTLRSLESASPGTVIVPIRAPAAEIDTIADWLYQFSLPLEVLWCSSDPVQSLLATYNLNGEAGKGRDVWMSLGLAADEAQYVLCHDADCRTIDATAFQRLLAPLKDGFSFSKAYYARVENGKLFGRLFRLFYVPLLEVLSTRYDPPVLTYLDAFRYALAGEIGLTADRALKLRAERRFGFEVGCLGELYRLSGFDGTAQVDLGRYEHEHRAVTGPNGLTDMSHEVFTALDRILDEHDIAVDLDWLQSAYVSAARDMVEQYGADARHNQLAYDQAAELDQISYYADAIHTANRDDDRLPAWSDTELTPDELREANARGLSNARE